MEFITYVQSIWGGGRSVLIILMKNDRLEWTMICRRCMIERIGGNSLCKGVSTVCSYAAYAPYPSEPGKW